jgi:GTP-binding protein EngB required for normal cell division
MQFPSKKFNDAVFAHLCQHGLTTEGNAEYLSAIGQMFKAYKPTDDPSFGATRSLQLDSRFCIINEHVPGQCKVFAVVAATPRVHHSQRRPQTASGSLELVKYAAASRAEAVHAPVRDSSAGFASLGSDLLKSLFESVGSSDNVKVVLQNGQGQSVSVERGGFSQSKERSPLPQYKVPCVPSAKALPVSTPMAIQAPAAPTSNVCQYGFNCKFGSCRAHHFSPAFYATVSRADARPNIKGELPQELCRFNMACNKHDCAFQHSSPSLSSLRRTPPEVPHQPSGSPHKPCCQHDEPLRTFSVTVLMCGETGSGKSTIINGLANLCAKSSMLSRSQIKVAIPTRFLKQSPEYASITGSEFGGSGVSSQTQSCAAYKMTHKTRDSVIQLCIIDSPGFSDTRGAAQDDKNMCNIIDTLSSLPKDQSLSSLVLVLNGATARHTVNVRNMVSRLRGNIPDAVLKNVVIVCTNCTSYTCNTDRGAMRAELGLSPTDHAEFFYIQNSAFSSDPDSWSDDTRRAIAHDWKACSTELNRLVLYLSSRISACSDGPVDWKGMRDARMRLKQSLHAAMLETQKYRQVLASLDQAEAAMKQNSSDVNAFSNYIKRTQQTVTELVDASYHSTICSTCNVVCHNRCGLSEISAHGDNAFRNCAAFSGDNCHAGSCRCSFTTHYHGRKTMSTTVKTLETVLTDIKAKYDQAVSGQSSAKNMMATLSSSRASVEQSLRALGQRLLKECEEIRKICSGFNVLDELYVQLDIMRLEASRTHDLRVRDQLHTLIGQVETLCKNLALGCS